MSFHPERRAARIEAHQLVENPPKKVEQLVIPRDIETNVGAHHTRAALDTRRPTTQEPLTAVFASSGSTRWTKGRGNTSALSRIGGVVSEAVIAPFVALVRGTLYSLKYAGEFGRKGAAFATGIVKNLHWAIRPVGLLLVIPSILIGATSGFIYGAVTGICGALNDSRKAIISQATGGGLSYFDFANRAYRD